MATKANSGAANLIPPVKGEIRNPNGRKKGIPNAATRYKRLLNIITESANPVTGEMEKYTQAELMDMQIIAKALKGDLQAYKEIMDRLEGKAKEHVEMDTKANMQVVMHDQARDESAFNKQEE